MENDTPKPRCCRGSKIALWSVLLVVLGGAGWGWAEFVQTYHLAVVQDGVLIRDGNRGMREFETALRKTQPKTIVSLIDDNELADPRKPEFADEVELLKTRPDLKLVRIPVKLGGWPTTEDVRKFLDVATDKANQPVLVHCAQGVRRTGMMVAAFQESVMGWDDQKAKSELLAFGHSQRTVKDVERFIDVYDAKTRTVTKQLEQSKE